MPEFEYTARPLQGGPRVRGRVTAEDRRQVLERLHRLGYAVLAVRAVQGGGLWQRLGGRRFHEREVTLLYRQLATLLRAGVPLAKALEAAAEMARPDLAHRVGRVLEGVMEGMPLHRALAHLGLGRAAELGMIQAGEASGRLDEVLQWLAEQRERWEGLQGRLRSALAYPGVVLATSAAVVVLLLSLVVPAFTRLFAELGAELPLPTRVLLAVVQPGPGWLWLGYAGGVAGVGAVLWLHTPAGRLWWDARRWRLPVVGEMLRARDLAGFTRTLGGLLRCGVPVQAALSLTAQGTDNQVLAEALLAVGRSVAAGETLAGALAMTGLVPRLAVQMVAVGERSGTLDEMLAYVAQVYDRELEVRMATLASLVEPVLTLCVGGVVVLIALAVFVPMVQLVDLAGSRY